MPTYYKVRTAVGIISFTIPSGDMICLLGPSRSGKTTAIRLLIGAITADSGEVFIGNTKMPALKLLRKIGFMPQNQVVQLVPIAIIPQIFFSGLITVETIPYFPVGYLINRAGERFFSL